MQDANHNLNIQHLLKATNHLRIAQREFQIAKQLSSGKKNSKQRLFGNDDPYRQHDMMCSNNNGSEMLRLQAQHGSAPYPLRKQNTMGSDVNNYQ